MLPAHRRARSLVATGVSHVGCYTPTGHSPFAINQLFVVSGQYSMPFPHTLRASLIAKSKGLRV